MDFRHEWKIEISQADLFALRSRLRAVMAQDEHAINGSYHIRSLYFDTPTNRALQEKIDGVNLREKFRIRYYNNDSEWICLEKKSKINGLCKKQTESLSEKLVQTILRGDFRMPSDMPPLVQEFFYKMKTEGLQPKVVVDYDREPFVYSPGNVRITFDYHIRTGRNCADFLRKELVNIPAGNAPIIMEVKWDAFLPDIIRDLIQLPGRRATAFSKYAQCRIYG